jgi:drug/metabolite transporter (DMT)-like permease
MPDEAETIGAGRARRTAAGRRRVMPLTLAAALVTVTLWASAFVGIRSAGRALSPGALSLGRVLIGAIVLGIILKMKGEGLPAWLELRPVVTPLLAVGVLWFAGYNIALNAAERRVDAGTAAMLVNIGPILIAILAGVVLREGFPRAILTGCAVAFSGIVVIGLATSGGGGSASTAGVALCLLAACVYSGGVVSQKPVLRHLSALRTTFLCCVIAVVACLPFAPSLVREVRAASPGAVAWMVYLGAFPTALGFTTWAYALARSNAGRLAAMTYLIAPISILLGWLMLGEVPPGLAFAGGALCLVGVAITRRAPPNSQPAAPSAVGAVDAPSTILSRRSKNGA